MPKNTPAIAASQAMGPASLVPFALRRRLMSMALAVSLAATLAAPSISLASSAQAQVTPFAAGHTLLADGPNIWGCAGTPTPC
ncbi:MAG TPA: hypothetical protein VFU88_02260 [Ktedonobacterales bacterium]|nr:hypothetical protein [Ktedonobacterales bacterium]